MEKRELSCGAALGIIAALVLIGVFVWQFPTKSSDWAAWVQAFGSIGAILGAVWIGERHQKSSLSIYLAEEESRENRESEKNREKIYAVTLMIWRMVSVADVYFSELEESKLIRLNRSHSIQIGKDKNIFRYSDSSFVSCPEVDYMYVFSLLDSVFNKNNQTVYINSKMLESLNDIDLLSFPYAVIADQLLIYMAFFKGFLIKLQSLSEKLDGHKKASALTAEQVNEIKTLYKFAIGFANCGHDSALEIYNFYSNFDAPLASDK